MKIIANDVIIELEQIYWDDSTEDWNIEADNFGFIGFAEFQQYLEGKI